MKRKFRYVGEWLDYWLAVYKKPRLKQNSYEPLEVAVRLHISSTFKAMKLRKVGLIDADELLSKVETGRVRENVCSVLKNSFSKAFQLKLIKEDPFVSLSGYKHKRVSGSALSEKEVTAFLKSIEFHQLEELFQFYLYTGVRRNEALAVKWTDVDFNGNSIHIAGTKTDNSDRWIPIVPKLRDILFYMKRQGDYLFPFKANHVYKIFKKFCPNHRLHDLRHTFATRCIESGIAVHVVSKLLGHGDVNVTMIYAHVLNNYEQKEVQKYSLNPYSGT